MVIPMRNILFQNIINFNLFIQKQPVSTSALSCGILGYICMKLKISIWLELLKYTIARVLGQSKTLLIDVDDKLGHGPLNFFETSMHGSTPSESERSHMSFQRGYRANRTRKYWLCHGCVVARSVWMVRCHATLFLW